MNITPANLAALAALASVASWCTSVRAASDSYDRPSLTDVYAALCVALVSPHAANLAGLAEDLTTWCNLARGRVYAQRAELAPSTLAALVLRAEEAAAAVRAAGEVMDGDPEDTAGDAFVEALLREHAPDPSPAPRVTAPRYPTPPRARRATPAGSARPADGGAGLCFTCARGGARRAPRPVARGRGRRLPVAPLARRRVTTCNPTETTMNPLDNLTFDVLPAHAGRPARVPRRLRRLRPRRQPRRR